MHLPSVNQTGKKCLPKNIFGWLQILLVLGDLNNEEVCNTLVDKTIEKFGCLDVVVSSAIKTHGDDCNHKMAGCVCQGYENTPIF